MKWQDFFNSPVGRITLILVGFLIYWLIFFYPLVSFLEKIFDSAYFNFTDVTFTHQEIVLLFVGLTPLLGRLIYQVFHNSLSRHIMAITMTWAGFSFFIFVPAITLDLFVIIIQPEKEFQALISISIFSCCLALGFFGVINANRLVLKSVFIESDKIQKPVKIIQLSDVHIGSRSGFFIKRIINKVNHINPDFLVITGDLVDLSSVGSKELEVLNNIQAPTYFVTGNHDRYVNLKKLIPILEQIKINVIRNGKVSLGQINLLGIDDSDHPRQVEHVLPEIDFDKSTFNILLYHRPQGFDFAASQGVDLMLSGHTHNGQIVPFNYLVKRVFKDIKGTIQRNNAHLHVSTGTSTWGPILRIGSNNEITVLSIVPKR